MTWKDIRAGLQAKVHEAFAVEANYYAPGEEDGTLVHVRHHTTMLLDEGIGGAQAQVYQSSDIVIFDSDEVAPAWKGRVVLSSGDEFYLDVREREDASRFHTWHVTRNRQA